MMERRSELGQLMHEEHFRTLVLICELENRVTGKAGQRPYDPADAEDRRLFAQLIAGLGEIGGHNAFEENVLFPLIRDRDEGQLTALLTSEHAQMAPMLHRLLGAAREIVGRGPTKSRWSEFCDAARALVAEMMFHLEKEELTVVQQLGSYLDPGVDHALALRYEAEAHRLTGKQQAGRADRAA